MAHTLKIYDGTSTESLTTSSFVLQNYTPSAPRMSDDIAQQTITESISVAAVGSTTELMRAAVQRIERMFTLARRRQVSNTGDRVFLLFQVDGDSDEYRSEIVNGFVQMLRPSLQGWGSKVMECDIVIERRAFWEGAEVQVRTGSVANGETGNSTTVQSVAVEGTIPTPAKIEIQNDELSALSLRDVFISGNTWNDPGNFDGFLTGAALSWTGATSHTTDAASWTLTDAMLADCQGDEFRAIAAFTANTSGAYYRMNTKYSSTLLGYTDEVASSFGLTTYKLFDLGALAIPPGGHDSATSDLKLTLSVRAGATGSGTLDFVQLLPARDFRKLRFIGYQLGAGESLVDDGIEGRVYVDDGAGNHAPIVVGSGDPIMLYPSESTRIYSLFARASEFDPTWAQTITVSCRPRRLTV